MRAWKGCRKSRLLKRKQTVSERRFRMRRACALGRNPSRRMAFRTRALVSRLTCELEFSTREIVPTPTPAARATSRMVVFCGTASIESGPSTFGPLLKQNCDRDASLPHSLKTGSRHICISPRQDWPNLLKRLTSSSPRAPALVQKHYDRHHFFEIHS